MLLLLPRMALRLGAGAVRRALMLRCLQCDVRRRTAFLLKRSPSWLRGRPCACMPAFSNACTLNLRHGGRRRATMCRNARRSAGARVISHCLPCLSMPPCVLCCQLLGTWPLPSCNIRTPRHLWRTCGHVFAAWCSRPGVLTSGTLSALSAEHCTIWHRTRSTPTIHHAAMIRHREYFGAAVCCKKLLCSRSTPLFSIMHTCTRLLACLRRRSIKQERAHALASQARKPRSRAVGGMSACSPAAMARPSRPIAAAVRSLWRAKAHGASTRVRLAVVTRGERRARGSLRWRGELRLRTTFVQGSGRELCSCRWNVLSLAVRGSNLRTARVGPLGTCNTVRRLAMQHKLRGRHSDCPFARACRPEGGRGACCLRRVWWRQVARLTTRAWSTTTAWPHGWWRSLIPSAGAVSSTRPPACAPA
jgi:hypothetical protein